jgi:glycosyltransferase involved in cell wall biosynthesis
LNQGEKKGVLFSVVVPTFDRPTHVAGCLEALAAQTLPKSDFEVVIVNDGGDCSLERVAGAFADRLRIKMLWQPNGGCAPARQFGIENAEGQYLAFTDDDCRPAPDWLIRIKTALEHAPGCAVAGRTINGAVDNVYARVTQSIVETLMASGYDASGHVRYAPTCNLAFPTDSFFAIGGLDRSWRISGGEDRDLCERWIRAGLRLRYESSAEVSHYHYLTLRGFLRQHFNYGRGAWRYYTHACRAPRFESLRLYPSLLRAPFRQQPLRKALPACGLVILAQFSTGAGLITAAIQNWRGCPTDDSSKNSADVRTNPAKRAS